MLMRHPVLHWLVASGLTLLMAVGLWLWLAAHSDHTRAQLHLALPRAAIELTPTNTTPLAEPPPALTAAISATVSAATPAPTAAATIENFIGPMPETTATPAVTATAAPAITLKRWQKLAAPFDSGDVRPRLSIIVSNLGLSKNLTSAALRQLPTRVTLSFSPYARDLTNQAAEAKAKGHELLLMLPLESDDTAGIDPGQRALRVGQSREENLIRLDALLTSSDAMLGVHNLYGKRFVQSDPDIYPVLDELARRGYLFVDGTLDDPSNPEMPVIRVNRLLADEATTTELAAQLDDLEVLVKEQGRAVAVFNASLPVFNKLAAWAPTLEKKGIALAPISAMVLPPKDKP